MANKTKRKQTKDDKRKRRAKEKNGERKERKRAFAVYFLDMIISREIQMREDLIRRNKEVWQHYKVDEKEIQMFENGIMVNLHTLYEAKKKILRENPWIVSQAQQQKDECFEKSIDIINKAMEKKKKREDKAMRKDLRKRKLLEVFDNYWSYDVYDGEKEDQGFVDVAVGLPQASQIVIDMLMNGDM